MIFSEILEGISTLIKVGEGHNTIFIGITRSNELICVGVVNADLRAGKHGMIGGILGPFVSQRDGNITLVVCNEHVVERKGCGIGVLCGNTDVAGIRSIRFETITKCERINLERDRGAFAVGEVFDDRIGDDFDQVVFREIQVDFPCVAESGVRDLEFIE